MNIPSRMEKLFNPEGYKTVVNGETIDIVELSRDDLLQVICENMNSLFTLETLHQEVSELLDRWGRGASMDSLSVIGTRLIAQDPDSPED
ncbi:hypothetical protein V0M98_32950 (plasmid) [Pseudomonas silesiensis]|uniref:hypothetical protein n=1 Tax=Pseudomonas silesiensis TaxID=1853130 RepID=UPI0030D147DE